MAGKISLNLAVSLDGYICTENGSYDWIAGDGDNSLNTNGSDAMSDFVDYLSKIDIVVMGGNSYREGFAKDYESKVVYVATSKSETDRDNLRFISGDIVSEIQREKEAGKNIFLFGGGVSIDPFIKADAIDQYNVSIIPIILGAGRRLFLDNNPTLNLHLDRYTVTDGIVSMTYSKRTVR